MHKQKFSFIDPTLGILKLFYVSFVEMCTLIKQVISKSWLILEHLANILGDKKLSRENYNYKFGIPYFHLVSALE